MGLLTWTLLALAGLDGGQWAGAVGELSDERVAWDAFTMHFEVESGRITEGRLLLDGESADLSGRIDGDAFAFSAKVDGRRMKFEGRLGEDGFLRGTCREGRLELPFIALREGRPNEEELLACAGIYRAEDGSAILVRKSRHLILDDFGRGLRRILYSRGEDEFIAGELFSLTDPPALRVSFERDPSGQARSVRIRDSAGLDVRAARCCPSSSQEFAFETTDRETLRGTLTLPDGPGPYPAVLWVHGSGRATRSNAGSWPAYFQSLGFATLAVDKRGVGESSGTYEMPDGGHDNLPHMRRRAGDVRSAIAALKEHPLVDASRIGLCGGSQAGWVIPMAAETDDVKFSIILSGGATALSYENLYSDLAGEDDADGSSLSFDELLRRTRRHRARDPDFRAHFAAMDGPGLWLYGMRDRSNPSQLCIEEIEAVAQAHDKDFTVVRFPEANHSLLQCTFGGARESRAMGTRAPRMFAIVGDWLEAKGLTAER